MIDQLFQEFGWQTFLTIIKAKEVQHKELQFKLKPKWKWGWTHW